MKEAEIELRENDKSKLGRKPKFNTDLNITFSDTKSKPQDPEFNFRIKCRSTVTSPVNQKSKLIDNLKEIVQPDQRESIDYSIWQKKTIQEFETVKR